MKRCPMCKRWTLEFDDYFGRYRCFNPHCEWMPASSTERELRLLETRRPPRSVYQEHIADLGLTVKVEYDSVNDVLSFDFGLSRHAVDLPEPDGRLVWKIDPHTDTVTGFEILEAKELGVSEVRVDIETRKKGIEHDLRRIPRPFLCGRPTRPLITSVAVRTKTSEPQPLLPPLRTAIERFQSQYCS